ncbi:hypothetical protein [Hyalangium gracile]|uniref:hypothetical protein n=1 Tax=Hyalangium gracile TaxID=394092 RepID=UPI001CCFB69D|nr:hypothetical protein [Hyalangium gracile]
MRFVSCVRGWCALVGLVAHAAWAGVVADVQAGQNLFLNNLVVELDGEQYSALGYDIPKPAGNLALDVRLSDFGVNDNQLIHATASVNGDYITWTFNKTFNPPVDIDGTNSLERAYGQLVVKAQPLSGFQQALCSVNPCSRNATLYVAAGTHVTVEGSGMLGIGWTRQVTVKQLRALAGIPRPNLSSLGAPSEVYAKTTNQLLTIGAGVSSVAPLGGTKVSLTSSAPGYLQLPPNVVIPQGKSMATVTATLKPNFTGYITVKAATNGAVMQRIIHVSPDSESEGKRHPWDKILYVPDILAGCIRCTRYIDLTEGRLGIAQVSEKAVYFTPTKLVDLKQHFGAASVSPVSLSTTGWMTGTLTTQSGATQAFKANFEALDTQAVMLGSFSPVAINAHGMVLGNRLTTERGMVAAMHDGSRLTDLPIDATWSQALAMSEAGHVVGVKGTSSSKQGFAFREGRVVELPAMATGATTVPVSVNQFGVMAGHSEDVEGLRTAVRIDASRNVQRLGELSGYPRSWATSINDLGWIVGTASNGRTSVGFLWTPKDGLIDLNRLADPREGLVVTEALKVTNDKQIVIKGTVDGKEELFVVGL